MQTKEICYNCKYWKSEGELDYEFSTDFPVEVGNCLLHERPKTEFDFCDKFEDKND